MYCLTDQQVEYILNDIRRNGIETEDLQLNLLDHVCCILERSLKENDDFERFYRDTIRQFYKRELREIEEETINLLTFKNYYAMKKVMLASGAFSAFALISGSFFKVMHWPGASVCLTLGIVSVSLVFLPLMAVLKTREATSWRDKFIVIVGVLLGVLYGMSTLFAVMHWEGRTALWLTTVAVSMFVFIPVYFFTGIRREESRLNTIVTSILLVGVTALLFTMIGLRPNYKTNNMLANTYLHNETLLKKMQQDHAGNVSVDAERSKLVADINARCEEMKSIILKHEIGMAALPWDFEQRNMVFKDRIGNVFEQSQEVSTLLSGLQQDLATYNARLTSNENKVPMMNIVLDIDEMSNFNGLDVLTNITQMQMFMECGGQATAVSMK